MKKAELQYKAKLADMACMICERLYGQHPGGNVELHHLRTGGWGRGDYKTLIPLCVEHHRGNSGIHGMGTKAWERAYDVSQRDLLALVQERVEALETNNQVGKWTADRLRAIKAEYRAKLKELEKAAA